MLSEQDKLEIEEASGLSIMPEFGAGYYLDVELFLSELRDRGLDIIKKEPTDEE